MAKWQKSQQYSYAQITRPWGKAGEGLIHTREYCTG